MGKGTQAERICGRYHIPHISTGDMLREEAGAGSKLGLRVKAIMESGELVPDEVVLELVRGRMEGAGKGFLLDGFPRALSQAEALKAMGAGADYVVEVEVPDETVIERLSGRRVHPASGRVYHVKYKPPKREGVDDETGEPLVQRNDDRPETVAERLKVYHRQTRPVSEYYRACAERGELVYFSVDGAGSPESVNDAICMRLDKGA